MEKLYVLKGNVAITPLINRWYVALPIATPILTAMCMAYKQIPLLESFIQSPDIHSMYAKKKHMSGSSFVDLDPNLVDNISNLLTRYKKEYSDIILLANDLNSLLKSVSNINSGLSLEPYYLQIPNSLKGYIELYYDMHNSVGVRFIEGLLYGSQYYKKSMQSLHLSLIDQDRRPFVLSTPVLSDENSIDISVSFDSELVDKICALKYKGTTKDDIASLLNVKDDMLDPFLCEYDNFNISSKENYLGENVRIRYFGHACLLIECSGVSILIDPFISYKYDNQEDRFTYEDLPDTIDYVLITHGHLDHLVLETLLQIRSRIKHLVLPKSSGMTIFDPSLKMLMSNLGFHNIIELDDMESINGLNYSIHAIPFLGEHHDLPVKSKSAYYIVMNGKKIFAAADSCNLDTNIYKHVLEQLGTPDRAFIGMECDGAPMSWFYGYIFPNKIPREINLSRRGNASNCEQVFDLAKALNCSNVTIYAMGLEPWTSYILGLSYDDTSVQYKEVNALKDLCKDHNINIDSLYMKSEIRLLQHAP